MVPLIELRGAIPVGSVLRLPFYLNYALAVVGNPIPVPFISLLIPYVLDIMERFKTFRPIVRRVRGKAMKNKDKIGSVTLDSAKDASDTNESSMSENDSAASSAMPK